MANEFPNISHFIHTQAKITESPKVEKSEVKQEKKVKRWEAWSMEDTDDFFDALFEVTTIMRQSLVYTVSVCIYISLQCHTSLWSMQLILHTVHLGHNPGGSTHD